MTTTIRSNGSKWAGEEPDTLAALFERLKSHVLDRRYNGFEDAPDGGARFWGNFLHLSAVFDIETDEPGYIVGLKTAIRSNRQRQDYRGQRHG